MENKYLDNKNLEPVKKPKPKRPQEKEVRSWLKAMKPAINKWVK